MAGQKKPIQTVTLPVMTVEELCAYLRVHRSTIYRLIKTGQLPAFRVGSDYRFSRQAIDEWRRAQEVPFKRKARNG